jgi:hypothetical protein
MWRLLIILCLLLTGCKTTQYVPVEVTKVEYINKETKDSIYVRDSIFVKEKNDTVFLEKYRLVYKDKLIHDTIIRRDSIPYINTVEVVKEVNRVKEWQVILMVLGGVFVAYVIFRIKRAILP